MRLPLVRSDPRGRPALLGQVAVLTVFLVAYDELRNLAPGRSGAAFDHAHRVLRSEGHLRIDVEHTLNIALAAHHHLALWASTYYDSAHYLVTLPLLALVYVRHPGHYRWLRDTLVVTNAVGLLGFALYPLAPPRMLPGYVDTVAVTGALGGWAHTIATNANELAAMPSLHAAWALWCLLVAVRVTRRWWLRGLATLHVAVTGGVIVGTGNHYLLDAVAGAVCLGLAACVVQVLRPGSDERDLTGGPAAEQLPAQAPRPAPAFACSAASPRLPCRG